LGGEDRSAVDNQTREDKDRDEHEDCERTDRSLLRGRTLYGSHPAHVTDRYGSIGAVVEARTVVLPGTPGVDRSDRLTWQATDTVT
jgi:hypothetical protein